MKRSACCFVAVVCFAVPGLFGDTWYVPDDFPGGIQSALAAPSVQNGDTVIVRSGTYSENIDFLGKAVWLLSESGPAATVIDGGRNGSVVVFTGGEGPDSILDGFTITNGSGTVLTNYYGGGIFCNQASPTIQNNVVTGNDFVTLGFVNGFGCGIACLDSSAVITGNEISHNRCNQLAACYGAGIYCTASDLEITDNLVLSNVGYGVAGSSYGGGICSDSSDVTITGNRIESNHARGWEYYYVYGEGGGIYLNGGTAVISGNEILSNRASSYNALGGGIFCVYADAVIENNLIAGNEAAETWKDGGPFPPPDDPLVQGGGIYAFSYLETVSMTNNTVCGNSIDGSGMYVMGAGVYCTDEYEVTNSIIWGNTGPEQTWGGTYAYCDVEGGTIGTQCIDDDPLFEDPGNGDYHLSWLSSCINRGTKEGAPATDLDGQARPYMGAVDMGAYEYTGTHALAADGFELSQSLGGTVLFNLYAGVENAGRDYLVIGGYTGTVPGFPLPGGALSIPVNWDGFTTVIWNLLNTPRFLNFYGQIDGAGQSWAQLNSTGGPLPPKYAGHTMYYAFTLDYPWDFVSNPVMVDVLP